MDDLKDKDLCSKCINYFSDSQLIHGEGIFYIPYCIIKGDLRNIEFPLLICKDYTKK